MKITNSRIEPHRARLDSSPADIEALRRDKMLLGTDLYIYNCLPVSVFVVCEERMNGKIHPIGLAQECSMFTISDELGVNDGDILIFLSKDQRSVISPSHRVVKRNGTIIIGGVSSHTNTFKRDYHPNGDVSSINIYNMLPWPLSISLEHKSKPGRLEQPFQGYSPVRGESVRGGSQLKGNLYDENVNSIRYPVSKTEDRPVSIIEIEPNTMLSNARHHGDMTVAPNVYFDDNGFGIFLGEIFQVSAMINNKAVRLYSFSVNDIDETNIFIGMPSVKIDQHTSTGSSHTFRTGTSIYRMSEKILPIMPGGRTGGATLMGKNFPGTDMRRSSLHSSSRSTNITARYKMISGNNSVCGTNLNMGST